MSQPRRLTATAKTLRLASTEAERILWRELRAHRFEGYKFRRQEPIGSYVADFICHGEKLIVELDGGQHASQMEKDEERSRWLESRGYRVVRFWNNDVLLNTAGVLMEIEQTLKPPSPPAGEGGERGRME